MNNEIKFSPVIAGTMKWGVWGSKFSTNEYLQLLDDCLQMGITTFDHADIYGHYTTEEEFGRALAERKHLRHQIQLITKCGIKIVTPHRPQHTIKHYDTSKEHIIHSAHLSLKHLHTDYIDVLLIHRPDPLMHPDEMAEAFTQLKKEGKVLQFGVSNFTPSQLEMIASRFPVITNQIELSILYLKPFTDGTLDQCLTKNIIPMAWGPLGGGNLFAQAEEDERIKRIIAVAEILAQKYNVGPDQILLSWLIQHPSGIIPVLGTSKKERMQKALEATKVKMERQEWFMLWRASTGHEVA
ncbi:MAG TPA: aldo/keto reductase [Chitinophagaceae bacterium]|nr:aldo/keto reductase [Chitinophagaceae bacterium]